MAIQRDQPYPQFNFLVDVGTGDQAGFQEVSGLATEIAVIEYRNGNARENTPVKLPGLAKASDVTLKRGLIGSLDLYQWLDAVRNGSANVRRTVAIHLRNEDHTDTVATWKLLRAFPIRHACGPLHGRGNDVTIEELVLACERIEME